MLTHLSLFSGIGGIDLAAHWAGFTTVGFVEREPFCQKVLTKHWPEVPIWSDVKDVTAETLATAGIRTVDLVSGGFPCQPFSVAGKRRGKDDDRYLWPEMFRIIQEIQPSWVLGENVAGFVNMGLDTAAADLEGEGYEVEAFLIPACGVGAPHQRYRVFIVAHTIRDGWGKVGTREFAASSEDVGNSKRSGCEGLNGWRAGAVIKDRHSQFALSNVADASIEGSRGLPIFKGRSCQTNTDIDGRSERNVRYPASQGLPDWAGGEMGQPSPLTEFERPGGREVERNFRGVAHVVSRRVDRLRALGNAVAPAQVYPILKCIVNIEHGYSI